MEIHTSKQSKLSTILNGYPFIIMFSSILITILSRSKEMGVFALGIMLSGVLNTILKFLFKFLLSDHGDRPSGYIKRNYLNFNLGYLSNNSYFGINPILIWIKIISHHIKQIQSYGFPSGHAMTSWFIAIYIILKYPKHKNLHIILINLAIIVSVSRIVYNYHTTTQVIMGSIFGTLFGIIYYKYMRRFF